MKKLIVSCLALLITGAVALHAADAKEIYEKDCAKCHGKDGKGQTFMGKRLHLKDYTDPKVQKEMKTEEMVKTIKEGVKNKSTGREEMKAFNTLTDAQVKSLIAYIRDFAKK